METILKLEETIGTMVRERGLPAAEDIDIKIKSKNGELRFVGVSFYVGEMSVCTEWCSNVSNYDKEGYPLDITGLVAQELDGLFHVTDSLYEDIAEAHIEGVRFCKINEN